MGVEAARELVTQTLAQTRIDEIEIAMSDQEVDRTIESLESIAYVWQGRAAARLAEELRNGPWVHEITGDLKAGFYHNEEGDILNDVRYALYEMSRPGNRTTEPYTPHNQYAAAYRAVKADIVAMVKEEFRKQLKLPAPHMKLYVR